MKDYFFNEALLRALPSVLKINQKELSLRAFGHSQFLAQHKFHKRELKVRELCKLCNTVRIPVRYFITSSPAGELPQDFKSIVVAREEWQNVGINAEGFRQFYDSLGKCSKYSDSTLNKSSFLASFRVTSYAVSHWYNDPLSDGETIADRLTFTMKQLLALCNEHRLPLSIFINDFNAALPKYEGTPLDRVKYEAESRDEDMFTQMRKQVEEATRKLNETLLANSHLRDENSTLQTELLHKSDQVREEMARYISSGRDFLWQAQNWKSERIPTVRELVDYCATNRCTLSRYIDNRHICRIDDRVGEPRINERSFSILAQACGDPSVNPDMLASRFCAVISEAKLTPTHFIAQSGVEYRTTVADYMLWLTINK